MIKLHFLHHSRAIRILWLLEELGLKYDLIHYYRDPETKLAPPELKDIHPLGKSPVLEDGDLKIAESGAIVDYLIRTYGADHFQPAPDTPAYATYQEWMHFAEGSAMLPLMMGMYARRLGNAAEPLQPRIQSEIINHFSYMEAGLGDNQFFIDDHLTGADIQITFVLEGASISGALANFPKLNAYFDRMTNRAAYKRALEIGGPHNLGTMED